MVNFVVRSDCNFQADYYKRIELLMSDRGPFLLNQCVCQTMSPSRTHANFERQFYFRILRDAEFQLVG
jgi:hypothetical protein